MRLLRMGFIRASMLLFLLRRKDPPEGNYRYDNEGGDGTKAAEPCRQRVNRQTDVISHAELDLFTLLLQDQGIEHVEGNTCKRHIPEIDRERRPRGRILPCPRSRKRDERYHEKPHDIHPKDLQVDLFRNMEHQMVIHPIDRDEEKT